MKLISLELGKKNAFLCDDCTYLINKKNKVNGIRVLLLNLIVISLLKLKKYMINLYSNTQKRKRVIWRNHGINCYKILYFRHA